MVAWLLFLIYVLRPAAQMGAQVSPSDIHQSKQRSVALVLEDHNLEHAWFQLLIFNPTENSRAIQVSLFE